MYLPSGGFHDLPNRRARRVLQHLNDCGLLAVLPGARLGLIRFILNPLDLCDRHGGLDLWVRGNRRGHLTFAPHRRVGCVREVIHDVVGVLKLGDQVAGEQTVDDGGFGTAAQIAWQGFDVAIRTGGGVENMVWVVVSLTFMIISDGWWASSLTVAAEDRQQLVQPGLHPPEIADVAPMDGIGVMTEVVVCESLQPFQFGVDGDSAGDLSVEGGSFGVHRWLRDVIDDATMNALFDQEAKLFPNPVERKKRPENIEFTLKFALLLMCSFIVSIALLGFAS